MAFSIRAYADTDFNQWAGFYAKTEDNKPDSAERSAEILVNKFRRPGYDPRQNLFFAFHYQRLVGYADLIAELRINRVVGNGFVLPQMRRNGIGGRLLDILLKRAQDLGAGQVHINVPQDRYQTYEFLRNRGFSSVGEFHNLQLNLMDTILPDVKLDDVEVGYFQPGEEASLADLQNMIFSGSWGFCPNTIEEIRYYLQLTNRRISDIVCLRKGEKKIGYVWDFFLPSLPSGKRMRIHMFGIEPDFRGTDLGQKLLQKVLFQKQKEGAKSVELTVDAHNTAAVSLYGSLGFSLTNKSLWFEKAL